jgi:2-oxoglutarate ferredoxin oxidoreductase subunit alpha
VPVFILTDQHYVDSTFMDKAIDLDMYKVEKHIIETKLDYRRYKLTKDGVSPRGIPGYGNGIVNVDSDEHDEDGHITEDLHLRTRMVDKRLKLKMEKLRQDSLKPIFIGSNNYKTLVIGWGSNYFSIKEALRNIRSDNVAMLYFNQVYPLHTSTLGLLKDADQVLSVENNATGQFSRLIHSETGFRISKDDMLLKYDGLPFPVERIQEFVENKIGDD